MLTRRKLLQRIDRLETTLAQEREKQGTRIKELENAIDATRLVQQLEDVNAVSNIPIRFVETPPGLLGTRYHVVLYGKVWIPLTEGLKDCLALFLATQTAQTALTANPLPNGQSESSSCQCYATRKHRQENYSHTVSPQDEAVETLELLLDGREYPDMLVEMWEAAEVEAERAWLRRLLAC
ncbi:hypothetical protein [Mobiluncus mulieris]|uniref:hypothetical protein n=1 Tax=Mobiluncus mulieris TaxID=2052 RepID=UPI00242A4BBB|nr:hypothetical protein [Mobiluncus mulieris]